MSILLHGLLGLLLGGGIGLAASFQGGTTPFAMPFLVAGAALAGAASAAARGDRQWLGEEAGGLDGCEIPQTSISRKLILGSKILGWLLIACGVGIDLWISP